MRRHWHILDSYKSIKNWFENLPIMKLGKKNIYTPLSSLQNRDRIIIVFYTVPKLWVESMSVTKTTELTFPGMKQQRLESTYFMKVMLSRERRVSTAARMSAWRASEWFLLSDSRLEAIHDKHSCEDRFSMGNIFLKMMFPIKYNCIITSPMDLVQFRHWISFLSFNTVQWDMSMLYQ